MLPETPTLVFTLPSIHDGLPLDCRVYHPKSLDPELLKNPQVLEELPTPLRLWRKHAAVVAHPYAPLGGCYNDPVVGIAARTLLDLGYLVMTFNFRGASGSAGRTSWTAKAERADYMSAVGFLSYYAHFLDPFCRSAPADIESAWETSTPDIPILIMAGYSYGSMVTTQLPSLPTILTKFDAPICLSHAAEIRLRAQHLAEGQNKILSRIRAAVITPQSGRSPRKSLGLRVGGEEEIRPSHEYKRGFSFDAEDKIRKGVADLMAKARKGNKRSHSSNYTSTLHNGEQSRLGEQTRDEQHKQLPVHECLLPIPDRMPASPAYLLISPLQGPIKNLATMSFLAAFSPSSWKPSGRSSSPKPSGPDPQGRDTKSSVQPDGLVSDEADDKLTRNPTLAVYGDRDIFVAARKIREWASRLDRVPGSRFRAHEVSGAGHFWNEGDVAYTMRDAVRTFGRELLEGTRGPTV
ncbi:Alpha/Beta hydrolase protein [Rhypophila decipiens]|uniref:Alpha/Beta hydrolase protein n=1 Tax=Rhypophila decipiens TaxID=261697 RepID=A0AAN6XWU4_9PEZI|nr:Alpha/Beta hydrolase protein [Rhypophila decipiens]